MRGLRNFITECLNCRSKEEEKGRVTKELANIRKNFGASRMNGYNRKKYVAKLLYIHLLGYQFDFGFPQMMELLTSNVFSEKQIGYITLGVYLNGKYDFVTLIIEHIRKEMNNVENEPAQCLALCCAANIGGTEIAETLAPSILQVLMSTRSTDFVKKKAALALVRLYRENPSTFVYTPEFGTTVLRLLQDSNFGVQLSGASLVLVLLQKHTNDLQNVFPIAIQMLNKLFFEFNIPLEYTYGRNPVPWLVMKYLRILQFKQEWTEQELSSITKTIEICLQKTNLLLNIKEVNTNMMLLFEAINLIIATHLSQALLVKSATILGGFLSAKQPNVRYLSLETLTRLVGAAPDVIPSLGQHHQTLFIALRDPDNSIRRRALSLLYVLCTQESAEEIVQELLNYLKFADISMREPLCLKIAVLAESFMTDLAWYIDVILTLMTLAGDECHDGVWHRVVQVVSMNPQYQRYATLTSYNAMTSSNAHDRLIQLAAQLVGDYAQLIPTPPEEVVNELKKKMKHCQEQTQAIILSALAKIGARYQPARAGIIEFIKGYCGNENTDIQQRAIEYTTILTLKQNAIPIVFKQIPPFKPRESSLVRKVLEEDKGTTITQDEDNEEEEQIDEEQLATSLPVHKPTQQHSAPQPQQQQQPMQQQQQQAPVDDLLGDLGMPQQQQPMQQRPQQQMNMNQNNDLLSALSNVQMNTGNNMSSQEMTLKHFAINDTGIAYEDQFVQLSLNIQAQGPNAMLSFNLINKSQQQINGIKLRFPPVPFFRTNNQMGPSSLSPQSSGMYKFMVTVTAPYTDPAPYHFSYNDVNETLKLPLPITKFMQPFPMDQNTFFGRWNQFSAPNQTATASFPVPAGQDPTNQMRQVMQQMLRIPTLPLQLPQYNIVGTGIVLIEGNAQGILARFYADPQTQRVMIEVKGTSPQITNSIQRILDICFK
ncbi:AP-2 complex subunit alpha-1-like [Histomonas meleagridis]|uniref:AP-2 complex subunit alpha-1-like n=1 Tax=Histomonas meleagridis TaxID=135588 RepID=UPI003559C156|nr:AP-2 complex subunit alpha-1-like [Histomonas meleagridis]KAH0806469.1 AP-2 complex subunit alpha-1-like [Histomonas meleagridis]